MLEKQTPVTDIDQILDFARQVLSAEADAVGNVGACLDETFPEAVNLILNCGGNIIVSGLGKSGIIAQKLSATLASTGTPSHFLHPTEAMHGDIGRIRQNDIVILISYGGQTDEVLALAALLKQDNVALISITGKPESGLARLSTVHLYVGDVTEACPNNLAPTASTTATLAMADALAMTVSRARDFTVDDFKKRHPGGLLGKQMMRVVDVLRFSVGKNLPLIDENLTVAEMLTQAEKFERRAGAVLITNEHGKLTGLFTDGDLRRQLIKHGEAVMKQPLTKVMTQNPRSLSDTALVRDAVQLIREIRVDELPVVDEENRPVGLIDVQDLMALKVIEG